MRYSCLLFLYLSSLIFTGFAEGIDRNSWKHFTLSSAIFTTQRCYYESLNEKTWFYKYGFEVAAVTTLGLGAYKEEVMDDEASKSDYGWNIAGVLASELFFRHYLQDKIQGLRKVNVSFVDRNPMLSVTFTLDRKAYTKQRKEKPSQNFALLSLF